MTQASTTGPVPGERLGRPERLIVHWTAGDYEDTYPHYHFCTRGDGRVVATLSLTRKGSHTWKRNSGAVGISMCGGGGAYPIRAIQLERTAKLIAECSIRLAIPLKGSVELPAYRYVKGRSPAEDQLVPTGKTILVPTVTDHRHYAIADGYHPARVDVGARMMEALMAKATWYADQLKKGLKPFEFVR
jgi:hypothetical protein